MKEFIRKKLCKINGVPEEERVGFHEGKPYKETAFWITLVFCFYHGCCFIAGIEHANTDKCRVRTLAGLSSVPAYALSCNLFKNRFDIKLN